MLSFVTQEDDFKTAIGNGYTDYQLAMTPLEVTHIDQIAAGKAIVYTSYGNFMCERIEDDAESGYMRVTVFI